MNIYKHIIGIPKFKYLTLSLVLILMYSKTYSQKSYEPTRESLSKYKVPEWYHDAKIGFFYHWGPQTALGDKWNKDISDFCLQKGKYKDSNSGIKNPVGQWGSHMYPNMKNGTIKPDSLQSTAYLIHKRLYGDPKNFGYKELIPLMSDTGWNPTEMVRLLDEAGVKYIVPQAIHHDGFAMWDSEVIDEFNAAKMGPMRNTTKEVIDAARNRGIKVGVSTHASRHSWYYKKIPGYDTGDLRYEQLYGVGLNKSGMPKPSAIKKWENTLGELVDLFHPDYIFVDGGSADIFSKNGSYIWQDAFRRVLSNYYNKAEKGGWDPVLTFKRESLWKDEAVPDYEGGNLINIAPYKWQTHASISGWFYRPGRGRRAPSSVLFSKIIDAVSKNGNILLNLAIKTDGSIQDQEITFLKDMATWMQTNGEGIHATRPWLVYGELEPEKSLGFVSMEKKKGKVYNDPDKIEMGRYKLHPGDIRYTRSKDEKIIYATRLSWPEKPFLLGSFGSNAAGKDIEIKSVSLLGSDAKISWKKTTDGIHIIPPTKPVFDDKKWPVMFKIVKK